MKNILSMTVKELIKLGHEIIDIRGTQQEGMSDEGIWEKVKSMNINYE